MNLKSDYYDHVQKGQGFIGDLSNGFECAPENCESGHVEYVTALEGDD